MEAIVLVHNVVRVPALLKVSKDSSCMYIQKANFTMLHNVIKNNCLCSNRIVEKVGENMTVFTKSGIATIVEVNPVVAEGCNK